MLKNKLEHTLRSLLSKLAAREPIIMPVNITLEKQFLLTPKDTQGYNIALPEIKIAPTLDNNPFIISINVRVTGEPNAIRSKIETAYQPTKYGPKNPKMWQLQQQQQLPIGDCILERSLDKFEGVDCHLEIEIKYLDSDVNGQPKKEEKSITQSSSLYYPPKKDKLEQSETDVNLPDKGESKLMSKNENLQNENEYKGWLAIDFGTSNSTVTIYDFKKSPASTASGFPKEQEDRLNERFNEWLSLPATPDVSSSEWENFVQKVKPNNSTINLKETIKKIEENLSGTDKFRQSIIKKLSEIYAEVFRIPSLESQNLFPVELDMGETQISSLIEIISCEPLTINMGNSIKQTQKDTFAKVKEITKEIENRFHFSPKRYLSQKSENFSVNFENNPKSTVTSDNIIKAAYYHLILLADKYRKSKDLAIGEFNKAVVTYPTVASPFVRENLKNYIKELGFVNVQTSYDEAVAVAMFYLFREFGGDLNVGIDSVKTRCRYDGQQWSQNVLVVDIGGGTTDIALINFTIEEKDLFRPGEDRGAGGRYYIITPTILGSSGNTQLGGDLITLRLFRWLKVAIADCVLTVGTQKLLEASSLANQDQNSEKKQQNLYDIISARELEPFVENGKYKDGSLLNAVNYEQDDPRTDELKAAEKILPTHWKTEPRRLQTFYTLWEYAEDAKVKLAKGESEFVLTGEQINKILEKTEINYNIKNAGDLSVSLSKENFNHIVTPVIEEAINLAEALVTNRFSKENISEEKKNLPELDWLILSGQTCHLPQVREQIDQKFKSSNYFSCNPEKITFVPDFSKLATSIGACYTEKLLQLGFTAKNKASTIKGQLQKGTNQVEINVNNLFYYLPSSFKLSTQVAGEYITLFKTGSQLYVLSPDPDESLAKARTDWLDAQLTTGVYREDFPGADLLYWGGFSGQTIANKIKMMDELFRDSVKLQFEIDQELQFRLFVCQGDAHYLIKKDISSCDINSLEKKNISAPQGVENKLNENSCNDGDIVTIDQPQDIAVNVFEAYTFDAPQLITVVFKGDDIKLLLKEEIDKENKNKIKTFHYEDKEHTELKKGLISEPLPIFPNRDKHIFCQRQGDRWVTIGELNKPSPDFKGKYYATLDSEGKLRIHAGEIPYYTSSEANCLKEEGYVYITKLDLEPQPINEFRDPFSGKQ